jgi:hypothetical protein
MPNLHSSGPDTLAEMNAQHFDLLPACIVSTTWPTAPGSGLTIAAFATQGYVRKGSLLSYVDQPARAITLPSAAGTYYLALTTDTHSTPGSFTRVPGSHYAYLQSASAPTYPDGTTPIASAVVSGGNITAVDTAPALTPPLSRQTADAVAITGGSATGLSTVRSTYDMQALQFDGLATALTDIASFAGHKMAGTNRWNLYCDGTANNYLQGPLSLAAATPDANCQLFIRFRHDSITGILLRPLDGDSGSFQPLVFLNQAGGVVGSISTTATATAYNTSSDVRLKFGVTALTGALEVVTKLRPVRFRWNYDDSSGIGFLAHEAQAVIPESVTGLPDQVDANGQIIPQGMDHSKLVPWLVGALQEVTQRLEALESALGV